MRILMLGWEFPPFISGGLGTACYGLTRALDDAGHEVLFVLPKSVDQSMASHVRLISPDAQAEAEAGAPLPRLIRLPSGEYVPETVSHFRRSDFLHTEFLGIKSEITSPYNEEGESVDPVQAERIVSRTKEELIALRKAGIEVPDEVQALDQAGVSTGKRPGGTGRGDYGGDVIETCQRYARLALALCRNAEFDVIHAHDWMTYPAGMALAQITGKPLVAHIHSTEFDRSGEHVNQAIYDIERRGMHAAVRVIAVSMLTKGICQGKYSVPAHKIRVIYNGVENNGAESAIFGGRRIEAKDKIVLFLGRITMQKGPEFFVHAARKVLSKEPNTKFLVAGSGDMARRMIELAAELGIGHKVLFTGFLRGDDVKRIFRMADCYVMPSVSEPFGIAPLEAMANGTPTIISKQSGVSEVLQNVLKVDFWDIDEMANKIVAVLRHPPLRQMLTEHGSIE
ncbi:MAG: glycosyltransferase, partial [Planctomycetota bacterium]